MNFNEFIYNVTVAKLSTVTIAIRNTFPNTNLNISNNINQSIKSKSIQ